MPKFSEIPKILQPLSAFTLALMLKTFTLRSIFFSIRPSQHQGGNMTLKGGAGG